MFANVLSDYTFGSGAQLPLTIALLKVCPLGGCVLLFMFGWLDRLEASRGGWSCACVRAWSCRVCMHEQPGTLSQRLGPAVLVLQSEEVSREEGREGKCLEAEEAALCSGLVV